MSQSITDSVSERCVSTPPVIKKLKVPSWSDDQQPSAYLAKYEQVLTANGEPKAKWAHLLPIYISGSLQAVFQADITPDLLDSYDSVKEILLEAMGDTASQAARKWWTVVREPDESYNTLYQKISTLNHRRLEPLGDNKQDILNFITLSKFLDLLSHACYNFVVSRQPTTGREAAKLAMEYQQSQAKFKTKKSFTPYYSGSTNQHSPHYRGNGQSNNNPGEHTPHIIGSEPMGVTNDNPGGNVGSNGSDVSVTSSSSLNHSDFKSSSQPSFKSRSFTCHGCGQPGHIKSPSQFCTALQKPLFQVLLIVFLALSF